MFAVSTQPSAPMVAKNAVYAEKVMKPKFNKPKFKESERNSLQPIDLRKNSFQIPNSIGSMKLTSFIQFAKKVQKTK